MVKVQSLNEHEILTLEEVSAFLRIPEQKLEDEIASGKLPVLRIAGEVRILRDDLLGYLDFAKTSNGAGGDGTRVDSWNLAGTKRFELELELAPAFRHRWPNGAQETYEEAHAGTARSGGDVRSVLIGFTTREAAGKLRKRAVVFVDKRPMVEFVGADDFDRSEMMVSLVKRANGKHLRPGGPIPSEYKRLRIQPYRDHVTGRYASTNLAVVCSVKELGVMVEHALLRLRQVEARK